MSMKIKFDASNNPEKPTLVLATQSGNKIGKLEACNIVVSSSWENSDEFSCVVHKKQNEHLWDKVLDFKLVWIKEYDLWFQITIDVNEEIDDLTKNISGILLGKSELSQINLYNIEINTEDDIAREDYVAPTILYNYLDHSCSLLHRIMEKAPHYSIAHVDSTIASVQRTFSFDDKSIDDAFNEIAEEIGCRFVYNSNTDEDGKINRTISVYDIEYICGDCKTRSDNSEVCSNCNSTNITGGYGEDTTIFITSDELAKNITYEVDTDSVKNCFKLEAGDDLMTATVRNINPNGTDYIWFINDDSKKDMSSELVAKLKEYDSTYETYRISYKCNIPESIINSYNALVTKYHSFDSSIPSITYPIVGYSNLINAYYNVVDMSLYLSDSLMPSATLSDTSASVQASRLNATNIKYVATEDSDSVSSTTADLLVLSIAKVIVDSRYQVEINSSSYNSDTKKWIGSLKVTNYSDEDDTATSSTFNVNVTDDLESFVKQKISKALDDSNVDTTDSFEIGKMFDKTLDNFKTEIKKYCLSRLESFHDSCQACIDILIEQGISDKETWYSSDDDENLYDDLYIPYTEKLDAIESEISLRESEINLIEGEYDSNNNLKTSGLETYINSERTRVHNILNMENYLGDTLWKELLLYRREDKYSNDNYTSDGLTNSELVSKAKEFFNVAKNEVYKSSVLQKSISASLKNLLAIKKFEPLVDYFEIGNWLRIKINDEIYKFRLVKYEIDFDNLEDLDVEFSDVVKTAFGMSDKASLMDRLSSMATSYSATQRQASSGKESKEIIDDWFSKGLDATTTKIMNGAEGQTQSWDSHGMLFRRYDDVTEQYYDEQMKIINSTIAITDDNWKSTKTAIGKFYYYDPKEEKLTTAYGINGELLVGKMILGEELGIYNTSGSLTFDKDGLKITNNVNTITINPNDEESLFTIKNSDNENVISFSSDGNVSVVGNITAQSLTISDEAEESIVSIIDGTVDADFIKTLNLSVGNEILMGENATISWENVDSKPSDIITNSNKTTYITKDYIETLKIKADSVDAENITGTTITGKKLSGGSITIGDNFSVTSSGVMTCKSANLTGKITASSFKYSDNDFECSVSNGFLIYNKSESVSTSYAIKGKDGSATLGSLSLDFYTGTNFNGTNGSFWHDSLGFHFNRAIDIGTTSIRAGSDGYASIVDCSSSCKFYYGASSDCTDESAFSILRGKTVRIYCHEGGGVYLGASGTTAVSSDENLKDIKDIDERYINFFNKIKPVSYNYKVGHRQHMGFGARAIEQALIDSDIDSEEFAGLVIQKNVDIGKDEVLSPDGTTHFDELYSLRYEEFIPLNTMMIKVALNKIKELEEEIKLLKNEV